MTDIEYHTFTDSYLPSLAKTAERKAIREKKHHKLKGTFDLSRVVLKHAISDILDFKRLPLLSFEQLRLYYQILANVTRPAVTPDYCFSPNTDKKKQGVRSLVTGERCSGAIQYLLHLKLIRAEAKRVESEGDIVVTFRASTEQELLEDTDYLQGPKESPKII